ncbi:MAG: hypothetical protein AAGE01_09625 [Pseudomonadota bacterium]
MDAYRRTHRWMIFVFVLMQLGIFMDYWPTFTKEAWSVHVHYWNGTAWYLYLIVQPYLATHGRMEAHRTNGIIGIFLAGGMAITALSMLPRDINYTELAASQPERFGPFEPWFFFGVMAGEIVLVTAFAFAVVMSILKRRSLEDHAWWLISTVFLILMPALGRGIQNAWLGVNADDWPDVTIMPPIYVAQAVIIGLTLLVARRFGALRHPATWVAVGANLFIVFMEPIGRSPSVQEFLVAVFRR